MKVIELEIPGCYLIQPNIFRDARGTFVKTYNWDVCREFGMEFELREEFYSVSEENVLRGMHFQIPPADHEKMVFCPKGKVRDVILDIRSDSPTFGRHLAFDLNESNGIQLFLAKGIAHGFLSLESGSLMVYKTSSVYAPDLDSGIKWDSFGCDWRTENPMVSPRDNQFPHFSKDSKIF